MDANFKISAILKYTAFVLIAIGIIAMSIGFAVNPGRAWANFLLNNYYFLSLAIGATFFMTIQHITQSGWSSMFKRIPEAIGSYIPIAGILMLVLLLGSHYLYQWSYMESVTGDELLEHKSPYLNIPFFTIRIVLFFAAWIIMVRLLRRESLREDINGGLDHFNKSEFYSKVFIFILAITFSLGTFDWIMSIDAYWFSTIFALKNLVSAFYHACAVILLILLLLNGKGYFKLLNKYHLHDFARYMFMLGIIWAYFWFSQFLLIWFANLPEETTYFTTRLSNEWKPLFFANIILNFFIPFLVLIFNQADRNKPILIIICLILIIGQWVDLYLQIAPGSVGEFHIGVIEIGAFLGFTGLFAFIVARSLYKAPLIPKNHPYLEESMYHRF